MTRDQGLLNGFINVVRLLGVLAGFYLIWAYGCVEIFFDKISFDEITLDEWLKYASAFILDVLLFLPWRFIRNQYIWWILYILFLCVYLNVISGWCLAVGWAMTHGHSDMGLILVSIVIALQFVALWFMRCRVRARI